MIVDGEPDMDIPPMPKTRMLSTFNANEYCLVEIEGLSTPRESVAGPGPALGVGPPALVSGVPGPATPTPAAPPAYRPIERERSKNSRTPLAPYDPNAAISDSFNTSECGSDGDVVISRRSSASDAENVSVRRSSRVSNGNTPVAPMERVNSVVSVNILLLIEILLSVCLSVCIPIPNLLAFILNFILTH